jgi:N-methylhydantoinase A
MDYVIGVDTGGTFTDVVALDGDGGITSAKASTTPQDLSQGLLNGVSAVAAQLDLSLSELLGQTRMFRFSGTTATNALLVRGGEPTGMITTAGFEDTLQIGRAVSAWAGLNEQEIRRVYRQRKPEPLVPRSLVRGVSERMEFSGEVVLDLDRNGARRAAEELISAGVKSIAVCLLWSIRNPEHELEVGRIIGEVAPDLPVHLSHEIAASVGEYERFVTTTVDAYVSPILKRFLGRLSRQLDENGFQGQLLIAQADGGCLYPEDAKPVSTLHSGPAAGVIASAFEGAEMGLANIVTTDVGGTSFDVGLVADGDWAYAREPELGRFHLSVPMIEVASVGTGGGSIAWVDEVGILHVGPQSAGASPGPACYGRGGTRPTVTDANLLLGYLDPQTLLGDGVTLSVKAAEAAMESIAGEVGLGTIETSASVFAISNSRMGDLLARQIVARGHDPRDFAIFAYGGAGPMHCAFYGAECGAREVIVPMRAGTYSALGVAIAPLLHSARAATFNPMPLDPDEFNGNLAKLDEAIVAALDRDGVDDSRRRITYKLEMRYGAQIHTVTIVIPRRTDFDAAGVEEISRQFDAAYDELYGKGSGYPAAGRFLTTYIVEGRGDLAVPTKSLHGLEEGAVGEPEPARTRAAYFEGGFRDTDVFRYETLRPGHRITGPAIVEATETTALIPPGSTGTIDEFGNLRFTELALPVLPEKTLAVTGGSR